MARRIWAKSITMPDTPIGDSVVNHTVTNSYTLTPSNLTANDASSVSSINSSSTITNVSPHQTFLDNACCAVDLAAGYNTGTGSITVAMGDSNDAHANVAARIKAAGGAAPTCQPTMGTMGVSQCGD